MPAEGTSRERDLVLAPGEYALILNETKGEVNVYVGPHKTNLDATDRPVRFDVKTRTYERTTLEESIQRFAFAGEGAYVVLDNPACGDKGHPRPGPSSLVELQVGRKVNIPGPVTFPLWPGQAASTLDGHRLRSNQYLVVRVYNEEAAKENWGGGVMKPAGVETKTDPASGKQGGEGDTKTESPETTLSAAGVDLTIGQLLVIKGTDVSFYIPPTGIEVVPDERGNYVRDAMTLERLEYCILRDENGAKRYEVGPAVVFPEPTEKFVELASERKFRAIELNEDMGIYVKVIADYEQGEHTVHTGEELFITGKDQKIYYPREEHSVIKYGEQVLHYGVAIPEGEARYVLDKRTGKVGLIEGPCLFLPDPRHQVVIRRILDERLCTLLYPDNAEALEHNRRLRKLQGDPVEEGIESYGSAAEGRALRSATGSSAFKALAGNAFSRSASYTPPRSITLDTKFDGAVKVNVWTGWAVKIIDSKGKSRVVQGPVTALLAYDESAEVLSLSTGKPKSTDRLQKTVYLRVGQNHVTDIVSVQTADDVNVEFKLSYRVNFEGDPARWFDIENYVKYLCDHIRSMMRHIVKQYGVEEFKKRYVPIVRDAILGEKKQGEERPGMTFEENGMRIYEVEVLGLTIGDSQIDDMLRREQHDAVSQTIALASQERRLKATERQEAIEQRIAELQAETTRRKNMLEAEHIKEDLQLKLARIAADAQSTEKRLMAKLDEERQQADVSELTLARERATREQEIDLAQKLLEQKLAEQQAEVEGLVKKAEAVSPELIAALQAFGDKYIAGEAAKAMAPLSILRDSGVLETLSGLLGGLPLGKTLKELNGGNGKAHGASTGFAEPPPTEPASQD